MDDLVTHKCMIDVIDGELHACKIKVSDLPDGFLAKVQWQKITATGAPSFIESVNQALGESVLADEKEVFYILVDRLPVEVSLEKFREWSGSAGGVVGSTDLSDGRYVYTAFQSKHPKSQQPKFFKSEVYGGSEQIVHYSSWDEAEIGHYALVEALKKETPKLGGNESRVHTILLVDDDKHFRFTIGKVIADLGFKVLKAECGSEAWVIIQNERIDLVLSDVQMPNGDGPWLLEQILKGPSMPVLFMTGGSHMNEEKALSLGARGFLSKPFSTDELKKLLDQHFGQIGRVGLK